jgi:uncharacterized protein YecE (DUF72 family)
MRYPLVDTTKMAIHIGTSGFIYKHWWGKFYPEKLPQKEALEYYSRHFQTVEINNTFYHLPQQTVFENWYKRTPENFILTLKASRFITHIKKLIQPGQSARNFLDRSSCLKQKLGPILFQLPPGWNANLDRLEQFLKYLRQTEPENLKIAFEFRNNTWITDQTFNLLQKYNAALCIHDMGGVNCPRRATADFLYYRFHGPTETKYSGRYTPTQIQQTAAHIQTHLDSGKQIYAYFNNDIEAHAIENARMLINELSR